MRPAIDHNPEWVEEVIPDEVPDSAAINENGVRVCFRAKRHTNLDGTANVLDEASIHSSDSPIVPERKVLEPLSVGFFRHDAGRCSRVHHEGNVQGGSAIADLELVDGEVLNTWSVSRGSAA